jgi:hypothetical protein
MNLIDQKHKETISEAQIYSTYLNNENTAMLTYLPQGINQVYDKTIGTK